MQRFALLLLSCALASINAQDAPKIDLPDKLHTPADSVSAAYADAKSLLRNYEYVRYISLYNTKPEERDEVISTVDFVLNSLNGKFRTITRSVVVGGTDKTLLRVDLGVLGIDPADWDDLGKRGSGPVRSLKKLDSPDPYFHAVVRRVTGGNKTRVLEDCPPYTEDGYTYKQRWVDKVEPGATKTELFHAPWVDQTKVTALSLLTHADFPVLRADWFIANALINPAYGQFLGVKTLADAQKIARFRKDDVDLAIKGIVSDSQEVALHIRAARRTPTASGFYWETFDYLTSVGEADLLKDLLREKRDAGEIIFTLPNTLQAYALVNDKDAIIDFADPHVAYDSTTTWRVKTVWTGVSCVTCHTEGIKTVTDEVRLLSRPPVALLVKDHKNFQDVAELYSSSIDEVVDQDKERYKRGVALATGGMTPKKLAAGVQRHFVRYLQEPLSLEIVCMETGRSPESVLAVISKAANPDHTLTQLFAGRPVRRDQWEAAGFAQLMLLPGDAK